MFREWFRSFLDWVGIVSASGRSLAEERKRQCTGHELKGNEQLTSPLHMAAP